MEQQPTSRTMIELWSCCRSREWQRSCGAAVGTLLTRAPGVIGSFQSRPPRRHLLRLRRRQIVAQVRSKTRGPDRVASNCAAHPRQPTHIDVEELAATARSITSSSPRRSRSLTSWPPHPTASPWTALAATRCRCLSAPLHLIVPLAGRPPAPLVIPHMSRPHR
jgi:hypothetical protein